MVRVAQSKRQRQDSNLQPGSLGSRFPADSLSIRFFAQSGSVGNRTLAPVIPGDGFRDRSASQLQGSVGWKAAQQGCELIGRAIPAASWTNIARFTAVHEISGSPRASRTRGV